MASFLTRIVLAAVIWFTIILFCRFYIYNRETDPSFSNILRSRSSINDWKPVFLKDGVLHYEHGEYWWFLDSQGRIQTSISFDLRHSAEVEHHIPTPSKNVSIDNHVIFIWITNHYYHFMFESMVTIFTLELAGIFRDFPNATILYGSDRPSNATFSTMSNFGVHLNSRVSLLADNNVRYTVTKGRSFITAGGFCQNRGHHLLYQLKNHAQLLGLMLDTLKLNPTSSMLYVKRNGRRKLINELEFLTKLAQDFSLEVLDPDISSIGQQRIAFQRAKVIIGPHGAGFTNIVYCEPSAMSSIKLIEMTGSIHQGTYKRIAAALGFDVTTNHLAIMGHQENDRQASFVVNVTDAISKIHEFLAN